MINFPCMEHSYTAVVLLDVGAPEYYTLTGTRNYAGPQPFHLLCGPLVKLNPFTATLAAPSL